jgi:hypothetical protein
MRTLGRQIFDDVVFVALWTVFLVCLFECILQAP